ncbi:MAG: ATP-grasp domain-containing protein [Pseudonocardia sp.]
MTINVFVLGLDDPNLEQLRLVPDAEKYRFHPLLSLPELQEGDISIVDLLNKARDQLDAFDGTVDALVGYWDFPVSSMVPILCAERGLPSAPLRAVTICEHKYWSRLEQRAAVAEAVPPFGLVDTEHDTRPPDGVDYPLWLKPIKGFSSELAYQVHDDEEFVEAARTIRDGLDRVGESFRHVLERLDLPEELHRIGPYHCLAEHAMSGQQVATEGYVRDGEIRVYGVLDSVDYPDSSVFLRHQYPSQLPDEVCERLKDLSERAIARTGLDNSTFSVEFFYQPRTGDACLLEINPRHSQSHAPLFELVDGVPDHHVMLSLALGRDPGAHHGGGRYPLAAKCYHRWFGDDGMVRRAPTEDDIVHVEREFPDVRVHPIAAQGQRLSELAAQDSYSYELATIVVPAANVEELERTFDAVVERLPFEVDEIDR